MDARGPNSGMCWWKTADAPSQERLSKPDCAGPGRTWGSDVKSVVPCKRSSSSTGWTAGLGVDYAFTDSVVGRIEYRYTSLETSGFVSTATNTAAASDRLPISDLRTGIAYKIGGRSDTIKF